MKTLFRNASKGVWLLHVQPSRVKQHFLQWKNFPQCLKDFFTPSCTTTRCLATSSFNVICFPQCLLGYLSPWCAALMCFATFSFSEAPSPLKWLLWLLFWGFYHTIPIGDKWKAWCPKMSPVDLKLVVLEPKHNSDAELENQQISKFSILKWKTSDFPEQLQHLWETNTHKKEIKKNIKMKYIKIRS